MALLYDHVPFTRAPGAHAFGPRNPSDSVSTINIRFARQTTARPTLWNDPAIEIAAQLYVTVNGGPIMESGGIGYVKAGALEEYDALVLSGMTAGAAAAQLIAEGKLIFGARGGIRVVRGVDMVETYLQCPLQPGINRVVTGTLGVRGGTFVTELTLEVL